jgi:hypothetical protein
MRMTVSPEKRREALELLKRNIPRLCIAIIVLVVGVQSWRRQTVKAGQQGQHSTPAPCSDKQLTDVDGLDIGQSLGDYKVIEFRCAEPNLMEIVLRRDTVPVTLMIAEPGAVPHSAPRQTERHDLYYTKQTQQNEPPTQEEIDVLLVLLSKRVEAAEKKLGSGR